MYLEFYGLDADPFRLSPDHNFCYRYPSFSKGRAYMQYALQAAEGFVVVTGQPGMGKTTLISDLLSDYGPTDYMVATLVNTMLEANEVLRSAAYEFGLDVEQMDTATVLQRLKRLFTEAHHNGRPPLLVVDEAQNLTLNALEELRMLTNLQAEGKPLLQIFLVGQEELRAKLQDPSLEQLRQRVTAAAHLQPLNQDQVAAYIIHRLKVVGWDGNPAIKSSVLPVIEQACAGVPRRINQFCSRLLLHGAVEQKAELDGNDARVVYAELADERLSTPVVDSAGVSPPLAATATSPGVDTDLHETPQAAGLDKRVMPPPASTRISGITPAAPAPPPPSIPPPRSDVAPAFMHPDRVQVTAAEQQTHRPELRAGAGVANAVRSPAPPPYARVEARYRAPTRPWVGLVLVLLAIAGVGGFVWYQLDRHDFERRLQQDVDFYLEQRGDATSPAQQTLSTPPGGVADTAAAVVISGR